MPDYVAWGLPIVAAVCGALFAAWVCKRWPLRLRTTIVAVSSGLVLGLIGWWLTVGLAFALLDLPTGVSAPWWATPLVEAVFMAACACAAFAVALAAVTLWSALSTRAGGSRPSV